MLLCCSTAKDVQLEDAPVPEHFTLIDGSVGAPLGKIDAGSSVQHSYVLVPNKGSFGLRFDPASVTYVAELDSNEKQVCLPSCTGSLHVGYACSPQLVGNALG